MSDLDPIEEAFSRATFATPEDQQVVLEAIAQLFDLRRGSRMIAIDHHPDWAGGLTVRLIEGGQTKSIYLLGTHPTSAFLAWMSGDKDESAVALAFFRLLNLPPRKESLDTLCIPESTVETPA